MDITRQISDSTVTELIHKDINLQHPSSTQIYSSQSKVIKNNEIIDISHESDKELSIGEERVIEECLNDTDASLSGVDLKIFNEFHSNRSPVATKNKKSMKKRISERRNFECSKVNKSETSEDEAYAEQTVDRQWRNQFLLDDSFDKMFKELKAQFSECKATALLALSRRGVKRIRRRSTTKTNIRKTHIYSFFNAMADLVTTFSHGQVSKVKKRVYSIFVEMIKKLEDTEEYSKKPLGSRPDTLLMLHKLRNLTDD